MKRYIHVAAVYDRRKNAEAATRHSSLVTHHSGVALVITLILLSVITFMAVTFLVVSRHEGAQVDTLTQQSNAKFAAETAVEQAKVQIMAQMFNANNGYNIGLLVSTNLVTNFYNGSTNLNDVSYYVDAISGTLLTGIAMQSNLNNLLILPRVPVFVQTNKNTPSDFRFYLDLNRNGKYDTNGLVAEVANTGQLMPGPLPGTPVFSFRTGDPEWIGVLNHPEARHSASNFFIGRYCYIALPVGNSLDINFIHNHAKRQLAVAAGGFGDGFLRNQGVGSYEINLAGFLNGLITNTNTFNPGAVLFSPSGNGWNYTYTTNVALPSTSSGYDAFADAASILQYRYSNSLTSLRSFHNMFSVLPFGNPNADALFQNDLIDGTLRGPLLGTNLFMASDPDLGAVNLTGWPGSDNPSNFFTLQDFFNKVPLQTLVPANSFSNHLVKLGNSLATEERYTFYRMLSQLGMESAVEGAEYPYNAALNPNYNSAYGTTTPKLNLNYNNVGTNTDGVTTIPVLPGFKPLTATNFVPWTPIGFFMCAADRMLRAYFPSAILVTNGSIVTTNFISITNIPIYIGNAGSSPNAYATLYTPAVQRILQLAANMYDASTNRAFEDGATPNGPFYPSVFRPLFNKTLLPSGLTVVSIAGYTDRVDPSTYSTLNPSRSLPEDLGLINATNNFTLNISGIPWVIGARKGFPNFNQLSIKTVAYVTRKIQIGRPAANATLITNIQYTLTISNMLGVSAWNSYTNHILRPLQILCVDNPVMLLTATNDQTGVVTPLAQLLPIYTNLSSSFTLATNQWPGFFRQNWNNANQVTNSFQVPLSNNLPLVQSLVYHPSPPNATPTLSANNIFESGAGYSQPHLLLNITNRLSFVIIAPSGSTNHVVDYVSLNFNDGSLNEDLTAQLSQPNTGPGDVWNTGRVTNSGVNGPLIGVQNQLTIGSFTGVNTTTTINGMRFDFNSDWINDQLQAVSGTNGTEVAARQRFANFLTTPSLVQTNQSPYVPTKQITITCSLQANDPLVHYMSNDLAIVITNDVPASITNGVTLTNLSAVNLNYQTWHNFGNFNISTTGTNAVNTLLKDPLITNSDAWQFPTNRYPNVGWLGRIHRGTPWQTVYLKPSAISNNIWQNWTGDFNINNGITDSVISQPTNDWLLMDLFTTTPDENASRGQLSVNQTGLAAWAAVLDGVNVLSNNSSTTLTNWIIDPGDIWQPQGVTASTNIVEYLVNQINATRAAAPYNGTFAYQGQILSVPQLTVNSPYLNTTAGSITNSVSDDVYEWLPQQIMSLLRMGTPRYVIFAYGQSLKPADGSIVTSGKYFGMPTNYQVTGEMATRTVLRVDNFPTTNAPSTAANPPRAVIESFTVLPPE